MPILRLMNIRVIQRETQSKTTIPFSVARIFQKTNRFLPNSSRLEKISTMQKKRFKFKCRK